MVPASKKIPRLQASCRRDMLKRMKRRQTYIRRWKGDERREEGKKARPRNSWIMDFSRSHLESVAFSLSLCLLFFKLPYQSLHYLSVCVRTCIFESLSFSSSSSFSFSYFSICFLRCKWRACYINEATDVPLIATCDKPSSSRRRT